MTGNKCSANHAKVINEKLYYLDPMNTGSVENELHDEYYCLAEGIVQSLEKGFSLEQAVRNEFQFWFGEEDPDKLLGICKALEEVNISDEN